MKKGKKLIGSIIVVLIGFILIYGYGYLMGSGFFFEHDYELSKDSTFDITGSADDIFMEQYTVMTQAGRNSYGKFFTIYKPTNKGEPRNTIIYTIFVEENQGNLVRFKIIDEELNELVYRISADFQEYKDAKIIDSNSTGVVVRLKSQGYVYDIFYPIIKMQDKVKVRGTYTLKQDNSLRTDILETNGRNAKNTVYEISSNFHFVEPKE